MSKDNEKLAKDFEEEVKEKQNIINTMRKRQEDGENELKKQISAIDVRIFFAKNNHSNNSFYSILFFLHSLKTRL